MTHYEARGKITIKAMSIKYSHDLNFALNNDKEVIFAFIILITLSWKEFNIFIAEIFGIVFSKMLQNVLLVQQSFWVIEQPLFFKRLFY